MAADRRDAARIRFLAEKVLEIAREERMAAIRRRWADVNALRRPDRAPVWCRPVGCWKEIITPDMLQCGDEMLRRLEYGFLQTIYKRSLDDDHPVDDWYPLPAVFDVEPANMWGVDVKRHQSDTEGGAWGFDPPLQEAADLELLRLPRFSLNSGKTEELRSRLDDIMGDILPVRVVAGHPVGATLGTAAAELRGLERMMMDMAVEPELMHRLMAFLRDASISVLDQMEATGLLAANNNGPMTCSDPIGEPGPGGRLTGRNLWCMANSQEFDQVSPGMWEEFCLAYQKPIFERFGLVAYGCCENLTRKIDGVLSIPNLRIFTCSAWTDLSVVLEKVGRRHCIMWRQKASDVVFPHDTAQVRQDLEEGARRLQGSYYQIVLRELETLAGHPDRLQIWTRCAKEAAERFS